MKKIIYILFASLSLATVSCDMNDANADRFNSDTASGWVQFTTGNPVYVIYNAEQDSVSVPIPVSLFAPVNKTGVEVSYTLTDVGGSSASLITERSGTFTITKDGLQSDLVLDINDGVELTETADIDVTLTATDKSNVSVGLSDNGKPVTVRLRLIKIPALYDGTAVVSNNPNVALSGTDGPDYQVTLTSVEGSPFEFTTPSAWGVGFVPFIANNPGAIRDYPAKVTINPVITVEDPNDAYPTNVFPVVVAGNDPLFPARYLGGTGWYDPATDSFVLNLRQGVFASPFTVNVVWTAVAE